MDIITKKYFKSFNWFYEHLGFKIYILVFFSVLLGLLDGIGISMFLPFLQIINGEKDQNNLSVGKLDLIFEYLSVNYIELGIYLPLLLMIFFFSLKGIVKFYSESFRISLQQFFLKKIRLSTLVLLNKVSFQFFVTCTQGRIQNTLTGELERIQQFFNHYFKVLENIILVISYMTFAFFVDFKFAIVVLVSGVLSSFVYIIIFKNTKVESYKLTGQTNHLQNQIIQEISNFKYLKATGFIEEYYKRLKITVENIELSRKKIGILNSIIVSVREPLMVGVIILVIIVQLVFLKGEFTPIIISLLFFYRALSSLTAFQNSWNQFLSLSGSIDNLTSLQESFVKNQELQPENEFKGFSDSIEIKNLSYSIEEHNVLKRVNFKIKKNKSLAVIGESGSGKTTIINLICGLLSPNSGEINIDGNKLRDFNVNTYQKKIGYITQEPVIFNDTLYNNITLWDDKNSDNIFRFKKALKSASLNNFLNELSQNEETLLGNNGINLSGGQRQRISIARELYKNIEILILDEATSSLDSETELEIQKSINCLKGQYTIIIVAHRISTIKDVDEIILLNNGEIDDKGSFIELINRRPDFQKMIELQNLT